MSTTNKGRKWYNDGTINKMFASDEVIPENFKPGKIQINRKDMKGKKAYTDGIKTIFLMPDADIPEGFYEGVSDKQKEHLYSIRLGGTGKSRSDATKQKLSELAKKRFSNPENHPLYGKHHSHETKAKLSALRAGKPSGRKGLKVNPETLERVNQQHIEQYGSLETFYNQLSIKSKATRLERYGDENYTNQEKRLETISNIPDFYERRDEKRLKTLEEKYGSIDAYTEHRFLTAAINAGFDSVQDFLISWRNNLYAAKNKNNKFEKRVAEFLSNNNFNFSQHYLIIDKTLSHEFDFAIYDDNNKLILLLDCDGRYYHGYESDINGKSVNPYSDNYRGLLVPDNVKFETILEGKETEAEGFKRLLNIINIDYDSYISDLFNECRNMPFPFPVYSDTKLKKSYKSLIKSDPNQFSMKARFGELLIKHFHPSIYYCNKLNKLSPYDAWNNDEILMACIKNRLIYKGHDLDRSKILSGFNVTQLAPKISIFNPNLSKYIISKYLNNFEIIFDPFSGYSGRLLGAASLNKTYIGQDCNPITVKESNDLIKYLELSDIKVDCIDSILNSGVYDCLFTCPPYADKENWNQKIEIKTCDEWIDLCLKNYKCSRYIFIVDTTIKYKDYIVEEISNKNHFSDNKEYIICIDDSIDSLT